MTPGDLLPESARYVAVHEAGHAIVSHYVGIEFATVAAYVEGGSFDGFVGAGFPEDIYYDTAHEEEDEDQWDGFGDDDSFDGDDDPAPEPSPEPEGDPEQEIMVSLAGRIAEARFLGYTLDEAAENGGGVADFDNVALLLLKVGKTEADIPAFMDRASQIIDEHWLQTLAVADALMRRGKVSHREFSDIISEAKKP